VTEVDDTKQLANRYLVTCDKVYSIAVDRADIQLAAQISRGALSVALHCANDLDQASIRPLIVTWYERLASLYTDSAVTPSEVVRTLKWASTALISVFDDSRGEQIANAASHPQS
jgi:hypothetical protein